jgi:hypothetical protein
MKLIQILEQTNSLEKNQFYKILNTLIEKSGSEEVEEILNNNSRQVKDFDNEIIVKIFTLLTSNYQTFLKNELGNNVSQIEILLDILIRDGNSILKVRWFDELYRKEVSKLSEKSIEFLNLINSETKDIDENRKRDYLIYRNCLQTAYLNDENNNFDKKITQDEYSILKTLSSQLGLSNEEVRLINFSIIPIVALDVENVIKQLRELGIVLFSKKTDQLYISDEIIKIIRELRGKDIADKYYRRMLNQFKDPIINLICKKHNISQRNTRELKIKTIINQGISVHELLSNDIFKEETLITEKKKELNQIMISIGVEPKGVTLDDKIQLIINFYNSQEKDEKIGISIDGYNLLCNDLKEFLPAVNDVIAQEFEFESNIDVLNSSFLIDHNIKPLDILDFISKEELKDFCTKKEIKVRGDLIQNILDAYTDSENIFIENYINLGTRDLNVLKINNININSAEIGVKYEEVSKRLLTDLGFNVDENLRNKINTNKDKIDILVNLGNNEVIIIECKTAKSTQYNKFSACSRQIKSYHQNATLNGLRVIKTLLIAPDFTQDFIDECELEIDLNLSLITSEVLYNIWKGFKEAKHKVFPVNLLMRDALISDEKILKALKVK